MSCGAPSRVARRSWRLASSRSPSHSSIRPRWKRTVPARGNRLVSGPMREKARSGCSLSKRPIASATRASASLGASLTAAENSRRAETGQFDALKCHAVEQLGARIGPPRHPPERRELLRCFHGLNLARAAKAGNEVGGAVPRKSRSPARTANAISAPSNASRATPRRHPRVSPLQNRAGQDERARSRSGDRGLQLLETLERAVGPGGDHLHHLGLQGPTRRRTPPAPPRGRRASACRPRGEDGAAWDSCGLRGRRGSAGGFPSGGRLGSSSPPKSAAPPATGRGRERDGDDQDHWGAVGHQAPR